MTTDAAFDWPCHVLWATAAAPARSSVPAEWRQARITALRFSPWGSLLALAETTTPHGRHVAQLCDLKSTDLHPVDGQIHWLQVGP
jgi:hypothetical protein